MKRRFVVELAPTDRVDLSDVERSMIDPALEWITSVFNMGGLATVVREAAVGLTTRGQIGELVTIRVIELEPSDDALEDVDVPCMPKADANELARRLDVFGGEWEAIDFSARPGLYRFFGQRLIDEGFIA